MKKMLKLLLCALLLLPCCGCLPATQLEERAIVQAAAVDYDTGQYRVTLQVFDPGANGENAGGSDTYLLLESSGPTLTQAFEGSAQQGKEIYLGSCQAVLVGNGAADQLRNILDYFNSRPQTRATMLVAVAENKAADLLKISDGKANPSPATAVEQELQLAEEEKRIFPCRMMDVLSTMETEGRDAILPLISIEGSGSKAQPVLAGGTLLQNAASLLTLTTEDLSVLGWNRTGKSNLLLQTQTDDPNLGYVSVLLEDLSPEIRVSVSEGKPQIKIRLKTKGRVSECENISCDRLEPDQLQTIRAAAAQQMARQTNTMVGKLCAAGCDPLRFGERLQRSHPQEWGTVGQDWPTALKSAQWSIEAECRLTTFSGKEA